jgi:signal recognition particle subunit SRP54
MFDTLSDRFEGIFRRLRSRGRLSPADVDEVAREIRLALLEADVNVRVVKDFIARLKERATGADVAASLSPAQQVIKIVHEELTATLGGEPATLTAPSAPSAIVVLVGLQGSGKTTAAAKLARQLAHRGRRPLLVAADLQRPAAVEQLRVLGERVHVPVVSSGHDPVDVATAGVAEAKHLDRNVVIVDTAGRLQVDDALMDELGRLAHAIQPDDALLTLDAMTGQEAVAVATEFTARVPVTGVLLTKLDGDARGARRSRSRR